MIEVIAKHQPKPFSWWHKTRYIPAATSLSLSIPGMIISFISLSIFSCTDFLPTFSAYSFLFFFRSCLFLYYILTMKFTKCSGNRIFLLKLYTLMWPIHKIWISCHIPSRTVDSSIGALLYIFLSTAIFHYYPRKCFPSLGLNRRCWFILMAWSR